MSTLYIVSENGWEYDDNNYYSTDGVFPTKAFKNKQRAIEEMNKMSLARFKSSFDEIKNYGYSFSDNFDSDLAEKTKIFEKLFQATWRDWYERSDIDFVVEPTDEDWQQLHDCCSISWYSIAKIELE